MMFDAFFRLNFVRGALFERPAGDMKKEPVLSDTAPDQGGVCGRATVNDADERTSIGLPDVRIEQWINMSEPPLPFFWGVPETISR